MKLMSELKDWKNELGPSSLVAGIIIGPGSIASALVGGSGFGLTLLWLVIFSGIWLAGTMNLIGRITAVTGKTTINSLDAYIFNGWGKINGWITVVANFLAAAFVSVGMSDALQFFFPSVSNTSLTVIMLVITIIFVVLLGNFERIQALLSILIAFITIMFVLNVFFVKIPLDEVITGLLPSIPPGSEGAVAGIVGGAAGGVAVMFYPYQVKAAGWDKEKLHIMKWDNIIMLGLPMSLVSVSVLISAASLNTNAPIGDALGAAEALRPVAGTIGTWVFVIGFFAAVWTTAVTPAFSTGYMIADMFKWKTKDKSKYIVDSDIHEDKRFKLLTTITLIGWLIGPLLSNIIAPFIVIQLSMGVINLIVPLVLISVLYIGSNKKIMDKYAAGWFLKIVVAFSFLFSLIGVWSFITFVKNLFVLLKPIAFSI